MQMGSYPYGNGEVSMQQEDQKAFNEKQARGYLQL
jgi:hypothetical protein